MAADILLYWGSGSPPCWRVMLCLEEKGLQGYQSKLISFDKKEHKSEEILKINPRGQINQSKDKDCGIFKDTDKMLISVPTFKHGDVVVNESLAICHYLEANFKDKGTKLIPDDPKSKAAVLQRMYEVDNLNRKGMAEIVYYLRFNKPEDINQELLATKKKNFAEELLIWDKYLAQAGDSSHLATKEFSMADVIFFPHLAIFVRMGLNLDSRANLKRYYETVSQRPSVKASWPPHWKDTPNMTLLADV